MLALAACGPNAEHKATDSTALLVSAERAQLATQLGAQKDSLTRIVLEANTLISHIDSSVSKVKGMPKEKRANQALDPLARQIENRKLLMARVDALVERARATANQLAKSDASNTALRAQLASDSAMITDLNSTIKRQTAMIDALSLRVDSLKGVSVQLASTLATTKTTLETTESNLVAVENEKNKVYYVIGKEDDLVNRGLAVREGGTNLLFAKPGRTLQIARELDPAHFTAVDLRTTQAIPMPDSTHRYRVISRQSLDHAAVTERDKDSFKGGSLAIADAAKFWAPSKFLVIVER